MVDFPSKEWLKEYEDIINASEEYAEKGEGWGVDFDGDFVFVVTDIPVDDISPDDLPEDLKKQMDEYISGDTAYTYLGLEDGKCTGTSLLKDPDEKEHGYELKASYDIWKELIKGEIDTVKGMMSGDFELEGDMPTIMKYTEAARLLGNLAGEIPDTEFVDEKY